MTTLHDFGGDLTAILVCIDGLWTLSFGLSQVPGHGSWLVCEVALTSSTLSYYMPSTLIFSSPFFAPPYYSSLLSTSILKVASPLHNPCFIGFVCRTKTMHRLFCFKSKFPNHFAFILGRYLFLLFLVQFILMWMLTVVLYIYLTIVILAIVN